MTMKIDHEGQEIEVYTAEEVAARDAATRTTVEGEYKPKLTEAEGKVKDLSTRLSERSTEFAQFRKLSEEQVEKLNVSERTIYENQQLLAAEREKAVKQNETIRESQINAAIRAKTGTDQKLFDETLKMYKLVGMDDLTQEGMAARAAAALGALGGTQPDLLASAGLALGSFEPPQQNEERKSFADTDAGKAAAAELGIIIEAPKQ